MVCSASVETCQGGHSPAWMPLRTKSRRRTDNALLTATMDHTHRHTDAAALGSEIWTHVRMCGMQMKREKQTDRHTHTHTHTQSIGDLELMRRRLDLSGTASSCASPHQAAVCIQVFRLFLLPFVFPQIPVIGASMCISFCVSAHTSFPLT